MCFPTVSCNRGQLRARVRLTPSTEEEVEKTINRKRSPFKYSIVLHCINLKVVKQYVSTMHALPGVSFVHIGDGRMQDRLVPLHLHHTFCF